MSGWLWNAPKYEITFPTGLKFTLDGAKTREEATELLDGQIIVTACGRLCLHRKKINISTVLAGQKLGIKEVDDGIWLVSFMHYDLGYFDLEQKTLQPLDYPFGLKPVTDVSGTTSAL